MINIIIVEEVLGSNDPLPPKKQSLNLSCNSLRAKQPKKNFETNQHVT
jgi:hypothetical protein